jgi:hypothetical protein
MDAIILNQSAPFRNGIRVTTGLLLVFRNKRRNGAGSETRLPFPLQEVNFFDLKEHINKGPTASESSLALVPAVSRLSAEPRRCATAMYRPAAGTT